MQFSLKPTIDFYRLFKNSSYAEQLSDVKPLDVVKNLVDESINNGQFAHCHADYCPNRLQLLKEMQEKLMRGVSVSSHYTKSQFVGDYALLLPSLVFLYLGAIFFVNFSNLSEALVTIKDKVGFKEKIKAVMPSLVVTVGTFAGLFMIINCFFMPDYLEDKISRLLSQSTANLVKDPEIFRSTVRSLYDAPTAEKILIVFEKGIMQRF